MSAGASFTAPQAHFPEIMQHMGLNCIDYATWLAPVLLEMHSNPPIKKSKFTLDRRDSPKLSYQCPGYTHTTEDYQLLLFADTKETAQERRITTWAQQTCTC